VKKKHHKKTGQSKVAKARGRSRPVGHTVHAKHARHPSAHPKPEHESLPLMRAMRRRRAAEHGYHHEHREVPSVAHRRQKRPVHAAHNGHHRQAEPIITEKTFEKMLAVRRFQHHTR